MNSMERFSALRRTLSKGILCLSAFCFALPFALPAPAAAAQCDVSVTVAKAGASFNTITEALSNIGTNLNQNACVVILDTGPYNETVLVKNIINTGGFRLTIKASDAFTSSAPVLSPSSGIAFDIEADSITLQGIDIIPSGEIAQGIYSTGQYVTISSVNMTTLGEENTPGVFISSDSTIEYSSIAVNNSYALTVTGRNNAVRFSTFTNYSGSAAVYLQHAASNTITDSYLGNLYGAYAGGALSIAEASNVNEIIRSTMTGGSSNSGSPGVHIDTSFYNTIRESYICGPTGYALLISNSDNNQVLQSEIVSDSSVSDALRLQQSNLNTIKASRVTSPHMNAVRIYDSSQNNRIVFSTVTSGSGTSAAVYIVGGSNAVEDSGVYNHAGGYAVSIGNASGGTAIRRSTVRGGGVSYPALLDDNAGSISIEGSHISNPDGDALQFVPATNDVITLSSSIVSAGLAGTAVNVNAGYGEYHLSSVTVTGGAIGLSFMNKIPAIVVTSVTFQALSPGATAIFAESGSQTVENVHFDHVAFNSPDIYRNVVGPLPTGSTLTFTSAAGLRSGALYESDVNNLVKWDDLPGSCGFNFNVAQNGSGSYSTIQAAVDGLGPALAADSCVSITDGMEYHEQITVENIAVNGHRLTLRRGGVDDGADSRPVLMPPYDGEAVFLIKNDSVTIQGLGISVNKDVQYGIKVSSYYALLDDLRLDDTGGQLTGAGVSLSTGGSVTNSIIAVNSADGLLVTGQQNRVENSTITSSGQDRPALNLAGASTNTFVNDFIAGYVSTAVYLSAGSRLNRIEQSTVTGDTAGNAVWFDGASSNTIIDSFVYNSTGPALYFNDTSVWNNVKGSTITNSGGGTAGAVTFSGASNNSITGSYLRSAKGEVAAYSSNARFNAISQSVMDGNALAATVYMTGVSSNSLKGDLIYSKGSYGIRLHAGANDNTVEGTTVTTSGFSAIYVYGSFNNNINGCYAASDSGYGAQFGGAGAVNNSINFSTMSGRGGPGGGVLLDGVENNYIKDSFLTSLGGEGLKIMNAAAGNSVVRSTITGAGGGYGLYLAGASTNTVADSFVRGSTAAYVYGSTGTVIQTSLMVSTHTDGIAFQLGGGSLNLQLSSSVFSGGAYGNAVFLAPGNSGLLEISSNTITAGLNGLVLAPQKDGAGLRISSITFQSLGSGGSAISFLAGKFITTIRDVNFVTTFPTYNVSGPALASGSRVTLLGVSGVKIGGNYEDDPNGYISWGWPLPDWCGAGANVIQSSLGGDSTSIPAGLNKLPHILSTTTCVVIHEAGSYTDPVTVGNFTVNGNRLVIMPGEELVSPVTVEPVAYSTAAFRLMNDSVTLQGISIAAGSDIPYGVYSSSAYLHIASMSVESNGYILNTGMVLGNHSLVDYSTITVQSANGLSLTGNYNAVAYSTITTNKTGRYALYLQSVESNTVTGSYISNGLGYGAALSGANYNSISSSTINGGGALYGINISASKYNVISDSYFLDGAGAIFLNNGSDFNRVIRSTVTTPTQGINISLSSANIVVDSYLQTGYAGVIIANSTGTVIGGSVLGVTKNSTGNALQVTASNNLRLSTCTLYGGTGSAAVLLDTNNAGAFDLSSNTITGGAYGLKIGPQRPELELAVTSITFQALSQGATAIYFTGGELVSTFTSAGFFAENMAYNVSANALTGLSRITMRDYAGPKAGAAYEKDGNFRVNWAVNSALPAYCGAGYTVAKTGGEFDTIQKAVDALPSVLGSDTCIVITDAGTYAEQVTVGDFETNNHRLMIMKDPTLAGVVPVVAPAAAVTAGFLIQNDSVTVQGIDVVPVYPMTYGVYVSSSYVQISSMNVISGGKITKAGILISSSSTVEYSSITVQGVYGLQVTGRDNRIAFSTSAGEGIAGASLYMRMADSNTVSDSFFTNAASTAVYLDAGSDYNGIVRSTITSNNALSALFVSGASTNTVTDSYIGNPLGKAVYLDHAHFNHISDSSLQSSVSGGAALYIAASDSNTVTGSYVRGFKGAFVSDSIATILAGSSFLAYDASGAALEIHNNTGLEVQAGLFAGGASGAAIYLNTGNGGPINISSVTITDGLYGLAVEAQAAGAALAVTSMTVQNLAANGTAINFLGGTLVSTFTRVAFDSPDIKTNVNGDSLGTGSSITMRKAAGLRAGPDLDQNDNGYVRWTLMAVDGCPVANNVAQDGGADYSTIQAAITALGPVLGADTCVVIRDAATYDEQITVADLDNAGYRLAIMKDPGLAASPVISPVTAGQAVFAIRGASVTLQGLDIAPRAAFAYGVMSASEAVHLERFNVISGGRITTSAVAISSFSMVSYSSITGQSGTGLVVDGKGSVISFSTMTSTKYDGYGLYLAGADSTTITGSYIYNSLGNGAYLAMAADGNRIELSTMASGGGVMAGLFIDGSSSNTVSGSYISGSTAAYISGSTGTVLQENAFTATGTAGNGLELTGGSMNLFLSSCSLAGGTSGSAIYLGAATHGDINISSNIVTGGGTGLTASQPGTGPRLGVFNLDLRNLAADATGIKIAAGIYVSTLTRVAFNSANIYYNVDGSQLAPGSRITMRQASGPKAGPGYERDTGFVDWGGILPAGCSAGFTVGPGGTEDFTDLQSAVNALRPALDSDACVVLKAAVSYPGQVVVENIAVNGHRLTLMPDPALAGKPVLIGVSPALAALVIKNEGVTVYGLDVTPAYSMEYGIMASSSGVHISSLTITGGDKVSEAALYISSYGVVDLSTFTAFAAPGVLATGASPRVMRSTVTSSAGEECALVFSRASQAAAEDDYIYNAAGSGVCFRDGTLGGTLLRSTAAAAAGAGFVVDGSSGVSADEASLYGSPAAYVYASTATVIHASALRSADAAGHAARFIRNRGLTVSESVLAVGAQGTGVYLDSGNTGAVRFSSDTFEGGRYGFNIDAQAAGNSVAADSVTFRGLSAGATAVNFLGGMLVSTFSGVSFGDTAVNVNTAQLLAGSRITVHDASGRWGPVYASDPRGLLQWDDMTPLNVRFTSISSTTLAVAWTLRRSGAPELRISASPDFTGSPLQTGTLDQGTTIYNDLVPNQTYYFTVGSDGFYSGTVAQATDPAMPFDLAIPAIATASAVMTWDGGMNAPGTWYLAEAATDEGFSLAASSVTSLHTAAFTGLNPDNRYFFRVRALGIAGTDSQPVIAGSSWTRVNVPAGGTYTSVSSVAVTLAWQPEGNPDWTRYQAGFTADPGVVPGIMDTVYETRYSTGMLTPNTSYYFRVRAWDGGGRDAGGDYVLEAGTVTAAAQPVYSAALSIDVDDAVTAQWARNDNPADTQYYLYVTTSSNLTGMNVINTGWFENPVKLVPGLEGGRRYYFNVKARNRNGRETDYLPLGSVLLAAGADLTAPTIFDWQEGDDTWRGAESGLYKVHFYDLQLDKFQVKVTTGPGFTGTLLGGWTDMATNINSDSYETDWALPSDIFNAISENTTAYVSVKAFDAVGNVAVSTDVFYVRRDTTPPAIIDNADSPAGWLKTSPGAVFDVRFADARSGLARLAYSVSQAPGAGNGPWTTIAAFISSAAYAEPWGVDFSALKDGASNYVSVKAWDAAGNSAVLKDVFRILKNTVGPDLAIVSPAALNVSTITVLSGLAFAMNEFSAVRSAEVSLQELDTPASYYYDGAAFAAASEVWLPAAGGAAWSFNASTVPFSGNRYKLRARAYDINSLVTAEPYPAAVFQFDRTAPAIALSTPVAGSTVAVFDSVTGTASDGPGSGLASVEVAVKRVSNGKWWNFETNDWGNTAVSSAVIAGAAWAFTPGALLRSALVSGQDYFVTARALDAALPANASQFAAQGATFTCVDTMAPEAVSGLKASTGTLPGRIELLWSFPGDDGGSLGMPFGKYAVQYATYTGVVFSTQAAQVLESTGSILPGQVSRYMLTGLDTNATYYLKLWVADDAGLWSAASALQHTLSGAALADQITGTVKTPAGAGVTGVLIEAFGSDGLPAASATTIDDGEGGYTLNGLADGFYRVQATWTENDFASAVAKDLIPMGYADADFTLAIDYELAEITGTLAVSAAPGRVSAAGPAPAAAGAVELWHGTRLLAKAVPDAAGRFAIHNLLPGSYTLRARDAAGAWIEFSLKLAAGETLDVNPLGTLLKPGSVYAYPNPARSMVTFHADTDISPASMEISVFSVDGTLVKHAEQDIAGSGPRAAEYAWNFTGGEPASGVYFYIVRLKHGLTGEVETAKKKFAVIR